MKTHKKAWEMEKCPLFVCETSVYADAILQPTFLGRIYREDIYRSVEQKTSRFISYKDIKKANTITYNKFRKKRFVNDIIEGADRVSHALSSLQFAKVTSMSNIKLKKLYLDYFEKFSWVVAYYHSLRPEALKVLEYALKKKIKKHFGKYDEIILSKVLSNEIKISSELSELKDAMILLGEKRIKMHDVWMKSLKKKDELFKEIGKRIGLSSVEVANCFKDEICKAFEPLNKINKDKIKLRVKQFQYYMKNGKLQYNVEHYNNVIKGRPVYPGVIIGKVKIVRRTMTGASKKDMRKFSKGNILVTGNTDPDMMDVIYKSAAIITDEGGILSHAAIVAREQKIPTIIGTNVATKNLKNGDHVLVDAEKGIVKKL